MKNAKIYLDNDSLVVDFRADCPINVSTYEVDVKIDNNGYGTISYKPAPVIVVSHEPRASGKVIDRTRTLLPNEEDRLVIKADKIKIINAVEVSPKSINKPM